MGSQFRQDAGWMAQSHCPLPRREQTLQQVVNSQVARSTDEDALAAADGLADYLDDGGRLAGPRWAVEDCYIAGRQGKADCLPLRGVQPGIERNERPFVAEARRGLAEEDRPQF